MPPIIPAPNRFAAAIPDNPSLLSPHQALKQGAGMAVLKNVTLSASGGSQTLDLFTVSADIILLAIYASVTDATTLANLTGAYLQFNDAVANVKLSEAVTGATMSGFSAGSFIGKLAPLDTALAVANSSQPRILEPSVSGEEGGYPGFYPCVLIANPAAASKIQFVYTTTDAPINAQMAWMAHYIPLGTAVGLGSLVAA